MKGISLLLLVAMMLIPLDRGVAQKPVPVIDSLHVDIWPDYDRKSVLVLLTGELPGDTTLPASVTVPMPEAAQLNAVARIDGKDGLMKDDIVSSIDPPGTLTFMTPDLRFRVEYYFPYVVNKEQRSFDYTWSATVAVNNFRLRVQRPSGAGRLDTIPAASGVVKGEDQFDYHVFPARAIPAGQPFALLVDYSMTADQLSVTGLPTQSSGNQNAMPGPGTGFNWALAAVVTGGIVILGTLIWLIISSRPSPKIRAPGGSRVEGRSHAAFCRNCGEPTRDGDRFCGSCGSELDSAP